MSALPHSTPSRRPMTLRDIGAVVAVEQQCYSHPWTQGNFIDSLAAGFLAEVLEGEELLGYFIAMAGVDELHLLNLTVAPRWHGLGHGSALLDAVLMLGQQRGLGSLWLEVRAGNRRARELYARRGFVEVGSRRAYYPAAPGREDAVVMSRAIAGGGAAAGETLALV